MAGQMLAEASQMLPDPSMLAEASAIPKSHLLSVKYIIDLLIDFELLKL